MKVLPILPVKAGKVVDLYYNEGLKTGSNFLDVYEVMNQVGKVYDITFFMDLDSYSNGEKQIELLKNLSEVNTIWVDPAARTSEDIIDPLVAGGDWVVMGSSTVNSLDDIEEAVDLSDRILPALHWAHGSVLHSYSTRKEGLEDLSHHLGFFNEISVEAVLFMDLPRINQRNGIDRQITDILLDSGLDVYLAGGIKEQDVLTYTNLGAAGVLLYINDLLEKIARMKPRTNRSDPERLVEIEPAVQLNPLGFVDYS